MPPEAAQVDDDQDDLIDDDAAPGGEGEDDAPAESSAEAIKVATLMGWKPPKDWKGDPPPGGLKTAEEFLADVPKVLKGTREANDRLKGQVDRIVAQVAKLDRKATTQDVDTAKAAAKEAFEAGDFDAAEKILLNAGRPAAANDEPPALTAFKERNAEWFNVDDEATAYATSLDNRYAAAVGGKIEDPDAHMRKVEAGVKKRFPELFGKVAAGGDDDDDTPPAGERRRAPLVGRGGRVDRSRSDTAELTVASMTPRQKAAAKTMNVSDKDYVKSFNDMQKAS